MVIVTSTPPANITALFESTLGAGSERGFEVIAADAGYLCMGAQCEMKLPTDEAIASLRIREKGALVGERGGDSIIVTA